LLKICEQYNKDKGRIGQPYPWFIKVLKMESASYFANRNIAESAKFKKEGIGKMADILKQIAGQDG